MRISLISTLYLVLVFSLSINAQNTSTKLLKSDTSWLTNKQLVIGNGYYDNYPNDGTQKKVYFLNFVGTAKMVKPLDRKLDYYFKKVPEAYGYHKKGRNLNTTANFFILTPIPIVLLAKQSSSNPDFWMENTGPIIIYGIASAVVFYVFKKIAYKTGIKAVPIYNKSFSNSQELHKY